MPRYVKSQVAVVAFALALFTSSVSIAAAVARPDPRGAPERPSAVLDPSFGDHGVVTLSSEPASTARGVTTGEGELLVSGGPSIRLLSATGSAAGAFGGVSPFPLPAAEGDEFRIGGFTIDPQGRLVVVGTSLFPESENPSQETEDGGRAFYPGVLRILRFLPSGQLDSGFGRDGIVETDLGLPPPPDAYGRPIGTHPAISATGVAIDPQGRIVVTGSAVVALAKPCSRDLFLPTSASAGLVARFTEDGAPDTGFGTGGLVGGGTSVGEPLGAEEIAEPVTGPAGQITYRSTGSFLCQIARKGRGIAQLTPDGQPMANFGTRGAIHGAFRALAEGPDGSVLALAGAPRRFKGGPVRAQLMRIGPDGRLDRSFGKDGQTALTFGRGELATLDSLAVDARGRVLVGGTFEAVAGRGVVLLRISAGGRREERFGPHGRVVTRVRPLQHAGSGDLLFDPQGRLVTVRRYSDRGASGLVIARYLLGGMDKP